MLKLVGVVVAKMARGSPMYATILNEKQNTKLINNIEYKSHDKRNCGI